MMRLTLTELRRRRLLWIVAGFSLAYLVLFATGAGLIQREMLRASESYLVRRGTMALLLGAGLYVTQFLILVFAVVVSVDTIAGEIASGTIHTVVTKPITRRVVILGKFGGHVLAVSAFGLALALGAVAVVAVIGDYTPPRLGLALGLMTLEGVVVLALSYLGGALTGTLANGLAIFMLYALALVGAWVERIGAFTGNVSAQYVGIVASLIMPTEALGQRAAWETLPPVLRETIGRATPFTAANPPSNQMVAYAAVYAVVVLALAARTFARRDL